MNRGMAELPSSWWLLFVALGVATACFGGLAASVAAVVVPAVVAVIVAAMAIAIAAAVAYSIVKSGRLTKCDNSACTILFFLIFDLVITAKYSTRICPS